MSESGPQGPHELEISENIKSFLESLSDPNIRYSENELTFKFDEGNVKMGISFEGDNKDCIVIKNHSVNSDWEGSRLFLLSLDILKSKAKGKFSRLVIKVTKGNSGPFFAELGFTKKCDETDNCNSFEINLE